MKILKPETGYPIFSDTPEDLHVLEDPDYRGKYILQGPNAVGSGRLTRMSTPSEEDLIASLETRKADSSHVYFIQAGEGGPIKIGHSRDVLGRLRKLQLSSPVPLTLLCTETGGERRERELHERFADLRMHGEWFQPDPQVLAYVERK